MSMAVDPDQIVGSDGAVPVGGYVAERLLRQGPAGAVLTGRATLSGRPVVVRLLADDLAGDPEVRARFLAAAQLGMRLSHPNVVRIFEAGVDEARPYVVTEYVDGETLAERLERGWRLSADDAVRLATHLAAGLAHAHASGVVHGALDADSILVGADGVARIFDFGVARLTGRAAAATAADDVYGLGAVLRQVTDEELPPALTAVVDAALAHPSVRPSVFDVFHQILTVTAPPDVWIAPAVVSTPTAAAALPA